MLDRALTESGAEPLNSRGRPASRVIVGAKSKSSRASEASAHVWRTSPVPCASILRLIGIPVARPPDSQCTIQRDTRVAPRVHDEVCRRLSCGNQPIDDVVDKGGVAGLLTVAVNGDLIAGQQCTNEAVEAHAGALLRSMRGEELRADRGHVEVAEVEVAQLLAGEFGNAVGRERTTRSVLSKWELRRVAVH